MAAAKKTINAPHIIENDVEDEILNPAQAEAEGVETIRFQVDIKGTPITLEVPLDIMDASADVMIFQEERKFSNMFRSLLGEAQWEKLRSAGMSMRDMMEKLLPAYQEATGTGND